MARKSTRAVRSSTTPSMSTSSSTQSQDTSQSKSSTPAAVRKRTTPKKPKRPTRSKDEWMQWAQQAVQDVGNRSQTASQRRNGAEGGESSKRPDRESILAMTERLETESAVQNEINTRGIKRARNSSVPKPVISISEGRATFNPQGGAATASNDLAIKHHPISVSTLPPAWVHDLPEDPLMLLATVAEHIRGQEESTKGTLSDDENERVSNFSTVSPSTATISPASQSGSTSTVAAPAPVIISSAPDALADAEKGLYDREMYEAATVFMQLCREDRRQGTIRKVNESKERSSMARARKEAEDGQWTVPSCAV